VTLVLARTGEKVLSMGLLVFRCSQCSAQCQAGLG
jgi:hypothetical protein